MSGQQGWGQQQPSGWGQPPQPPQPPGWGQQQGGQPQQPPQWAPPPTGGSGGPTKYCPSCGSVIDARAIDCPRCGARQPDAVYSEPKSRPIAILLALLVGWLGIHRFYVGPVSWGVLYLIFFWTGIPSLLAWLEALYWLTRSDVEWAQKYGGPVQQANGCAIGCLWVWALLPLLGLLLILPLLFFGAGVGILSELGARI